MKFVYQLSFMVGYCGLLFGKLPFEMPKNNIILLGAIQLNQTVKNIDFPILYKGHEYTARIENSSDTAHFELYDTEKPSCLYLLITEYLSLPTSTEVNHLKTSAKHPYKLFKLILKKESTLKDGLLSFSYRWDVQECDNNVPEVIIPDSTIIVFLDSSLVDSIEKPHEVKDAAIIHIPTLIVKNTPDIRSIADKMECALIDFRFLHKKSSLAFVPYANNRILSMPYTSRRIRI